MDELTPGIRLEVLQDQRLGGNYSHIDRIVTALEKAQVEVKPGSGSVYVWDPVTMTHTRIS